jgi:hypothetical protein
LTPGPAIEENCESDSEDVTCPTSFSPKANDTIAPLPTQAGPLKIIPKYAPSHPKYPQWLEQMSCMGLEVEEEPLLRRRSKRIKDREMEKLAQTEQEKNDLQVV